MKIKKHIIILYYIKHTYVYNTYINNEFAYKKTNKNAFILAANHL
jgi:hypothetical protein